jgi:hypothetical protein
VQRAQRTAPRVPVDHVPGELHLRLRHRPEPDHTLLDAALDQNHGRVRDDHAEGEACIAPGALGHPRDAT